MRPKISCLLTVLALTIPANADEPKTNLADKLRSLDLKTALKDVLPENPLQEWAKEQRRRCNAVNREDLKAWRKVQTRADWEKFKAPRLDALRVSLGRFPAPPEKVPVHVSKKIEGDGFIIENLVYQSRPGLWVTANLYSPAKPASKMLGILIIHSHHNPKTQGELQDMGMTWARQGCLVLVPDQLGHGERRQHPFSDASKYSEPFKVGRQDYYFRYNVALQLHLVGESLIGWMAWDMMRGVDLLLAKPGIDKEAIILLGSVAGGGDPAAVTAALDQRISAVAPFNFGGPQPETKFPLPDNAEEAFNYMGGGSWESTRNLRLSGSGGFLPWLIVGSVAPRGLIYGHEFAWDQKRDPVWARFQKIHGFYDGPPRLSSVHGSGSVSGTAPESTHCNNIGAVHRKQIYPALKDWFGIGIPAKEYQNRMPSADLLCWTDELNMQELKPTAVWKLANEIGQKRLAEARKDRPVGPEGAPQLQKEWRKILGEVRSVDAKIDKFRLAGNLVRTAGVRADKLGYHLVFAPPKKEKYPVVVALAPQGAQVFIKQRADEMAALLNQGIGVCVTELRGMGSSSRGRASGSASLSATELMLGQTVLGMQLRDLQTLLKELRRDDEIDSARIALWGDSLAPVNGHPKEPADENLAVPYDVEKFPALADPGGAMLALLAALYDPTIKSVYVRGGLVSYQSMLQSPFVYLPHDAIVPGALTVSDWNDVAAALAPRSVRLEALVDGLNRAAVDEVTAPFYASTHDAFKNAGAADRFLVQSTSSSPEALARWLSAELRK